MAQSAADINVRLGALVDEFSLSRLLSALADVARDKAEHIRSNWQDDQTARVWDAAAKRIDRAATNMTV